MDIQIGKLYKNKTWSYLLPCLRGHGDFFIQKFNHTYKLAVGIHDSLLDGSPISNGRNIYILVDKDFNKTAFNDFRNYVTAQEYFIGDYCPDSELLTSRKHMFILSVPTVFNSAYDQFLRGQYSKMYTKEEIEILFSHPTKLREFRVLRRDPKALDDFVLNLNKEFKVMSNPDDYLTAEWDLPLKKKEEIFNYTKGEVFFNEDKDIVWQLEREDI